MTVSCVTFAGNVAMVAGGAICKQDQGNLSITDSSFDTYSPYSKQKKYFGGEIIYNFGELAMRRIRIRSIDNFSEENSLIVQISRQESIKVNDINITCSTGKDISAVVPEELSVLNDAVVALNVKCSACPPQHYSVQKGKLGPKLKHQIHIHCYNCPFGGNCLNGQIKAAENFWGFTKKSNNLEIRFAACPYGYCCIKVQCKRYNSCGNERHGTLCGRCKPNLVENIFTPACLKPKDCYHPWFWCIIGMAGVLYVLFLVYQNETVNFVVAILVPGHILKSIKHVLFYTLKNVINKIFKSSSSIDPVTDDISPESIEYEAMQIELKDPMEEGESFFPGLLKIVFFFYQTNILFKVHSGEKSHKFINFLEEAVTALFNVRAEGLFFQNISWCPFYGLKPLHKLLFKTSFVFYMLIVISVSVFICKISRLVKPNYDTKAFYSRLNCGILRILLISYNTVTVSCFTLVSCVELGSFGKVLYIDGTIKCFIWWQYLVIAIICIWIAIYPAGIYASSSLFHNNQLTKGKYLLSILLPLPTVLYWAFIKIRLQNNNADRVDDAPLDPNTREMLNVLEGPFRKFHGTSKSNNYKLPWEAVLILRRLILIITRTFINDVFLRLFLMQVSMILFVVHHIHVQPYSIKVLNNIETVSLLMLTVICIVNTVPGYIYMNPLFVSSYIQHLLIPLRKVETVLLLIVPFIVGLCICALVVIRILQFLYLMFKICARVICFCFKRKQS